MTAGVACVIGSDYHGEIVEVARHGAEREPAWALSWAGGVTGRQARWSNAHRAEGKAWFAVPDEYPKNAVYNGLR